jgi:hypothetical protein
MSAYVFPSSEYDEANSALLCVPIAFLPFLRRGYEVLQERDTWYNRETWWRAYQIAAWIEEQALMGCMNDLVESHERLYRLLDRAINGTEYTTAPDPDTPGEVLITPEIPEVPPTTPAIAPGLLARLERLIAIQDNFANGRIYLPDGNNPADPQLDNAVSMRQQLILMQGIINAGWFGIGGENATIADLVNALRIGDNNQRLQLSTSLNDILSAGGNIASIAGFVQSILADTVSNVREGSLQGVLIAATLANASILAQLAIQQEQVLQALRGTFPTGDNLLQALRGDTPASATRNVVDAARNTELVEEVDQVEELLAGIHQLLGGQP